MASIPNIKLNDGHVIPQIGLGLWQVKDAKEFKTAFDAAIDAGYRHFDDAQVYQNEQFLGTDWHKSSIARDDLFITTKIAIDNFGYNNVHKSFSESLEKLATDHVDLILLHWPFSGTRAESWRALEEIQAQGKARSIGVSNYTIRHLKEMKTYAKVTPAVNQVELHVFLQQPELLDYCKQAGIAVEAYSPLAHGAQMKNPAIRQIAERHNKTYAQIMLRWCIEKGLIVLPKSVMPERIRENFDVFDFSLDADDTKKLTGLDRDFRTCWDPETDPRAT
ncbi:2,5-diketo-D-gluconic acid reductase [Alphaproteobacteria bacterium]|nr:2,5-diketo-D-gluconic acid reductase [Alphaproteobacteria bacterium]